MNLVSTFPTRLSKPKFQARLVPCLKAMRSFVLALTKWFPECTHIKPSLPPKEFDDNLPTTSDSDNEPDEESAEGHNWQRLERVREKFERLRQANKDKLDYQQDKQPCMYDDEKAEVP